MKIGIMQPYFFPYISYFQLISCVDTFVVYDDVSFIKKGWINRNYIMTASGKIQFNIPIERISQNRNINEHLIVEDEAWRLKLLKQVSQNYSRYPFYPEVFPVFNEIINNEERVISKFILNSLNILIKKLSLETKLRLSSDLDYPREFKGEEKILELCQQLGATEYINPIGGQDLYGKGIFKARDIKLSFLQSTYCEEAIQGKKVSFLDTLMRYGFQEVKSKLAEFEKV